MSKYLCYLLPVAYFGLVILFYPFRFVSEFDPDEGLSLIMASQITEGFSLYSEVWTDHPPLLPLSLAAIFRISGNNVAIARLSILLLSCVLIWATMVYLRSFWGSLHAWIGGVLLILLPQYSRLSVSVMIGLPSIAFAMSSFVCLAFWHRRRVNLLLILSGLFLGISVMIKFQTGFLAPIFMMGVLIDVFRNRGEARSWMVLLKPVFIWLLVFSSFVMMVWMLFIGNEGVSQLFEFHLTARSSEDLLSWSGSIAQLVLESWPIFFLGIIGSALAIKARSFSASYLIMWILIGFVLLTQLKPLWYHHQLLLTVPACMLAAIALGEGFRALRRSQGDQARPHWSTSLAVLSGVFLAAYLYLRLPPAISEYRYDFPNIRPPTTPPTPRQEMLAIISDHADETSLMVTDRPMFAFRTGIAIPPELAVFSGKRFLTGNLTEAEVLRVIQSTNPEQVALTRFSMPEVEAYLAEDYDRIGEKMTFPEIFSEILSVL